MLPKYTFALGGTQAVKDITTFMAEQKEVAKRIADKLKTQEDYKIG